MKKIISIIMVLVLVLSACGESSSSDVEMTSDCGEERALVDLWTFWASETRKPIIDGIVDDFNNSQDEYCAVHTALPYGDIWTKNTASIASGNPADIIVNDIWSVGFRAEEAQVEPITDYIDNDDNMDMSNFQPNVSEAMQFEGDVYSLPFNIDTRVVYYDKDVLSEYDINPETLTNWDSFQEASFKLAEGSIDDGWSRIGFATEFGNGGVDTFIASANQGELPYYDGTNGDYTWHFNTPENIAAFEYQKEFQDYYGLENIQAKQADYQNGLKDALISGEVGFVVQTTAYAGYLEANSDINYGVMPIPEMEDGTGHYANGGGFSLEIPKGAGNPDGGYALMSYMAQDEAQITWSNSSGDLSANISVAENPDVIEKEVTKVGYENLDNTYDIIAAPNDAFDYLQEWEAIRNEINIQVTPIEEGLDEADETMENKY